MKQKLLLTAIILLSFTAFAIAQVAYTVPDGGWTYVYEGDELQAIFGDPDIMLDGTWSEHITNKWDGTAPGDPLGFVGGVELIVEQDQDYLRIQDAGRPSDHVPDDFNRKIAFTHDLTFDGILGNELILDVGTTLAFRLKVPVDDGSGGIDQIWKPDAYWADGGTADTEKYPYPVEGDGYGVAEGMGMVAIGQNHSGLGGLGDIGFSLMTLYDNDSIATLGEGLYMNSLFGTTLEARPEIWRNGQDAIDPPGVHNMVPCTPTDWNEFWIQIVADGVVGTHTVKVWMNGDVSSPSEFTVTASDKGQIDAPYLWIGFVNSDDWGAMDLDYVAVKNALVDPVAAGVGTFDMSFGESQLRSYPNPSDGSLTFSFNLQRDGYTTLEVYNLIGQPVAKILSKDLPAGEHTFSANVDLAPGQYVYRLQSNDQNEIRKMTILK